MLVKLTNQLLVFFKFLADDIKKAYRKMALKYHPVSNHIGIPHSWRPIISQMYFVRIFVGQEQGRRGGS